MRVSNPGRYAAAVITAAFGVLAVIMLQHIVFLHNAEKSVAMYENIYINGVAVGGLTKDDAEARLRDYFQPLLDEKTISLNDGGNTILTWRFKDFEARYDFSSLIDEAWRYGRAGSSAERYKQLNSLSHTPYAVNGPLIYRYDGALVGQRVTQAAEKVYAAPVNAGLRRESSQIHVIKGQEGKKMDEAAVMAAVRVLLDECREGAAEAVYEAVPPAYASTDFSYPKTFIGSYGTYYRGAENDARNINLRAAANRINNTMLYPGETFSASAALGPTTPENGYARATVIVDGKPVDDYGGGVCQAVTTLYNAVLYAELSVTERFNHSLRVSYADYGFDATVAGDYFDLKFKNDTPYPLLITCDMQNGVITAGLYGYEVHGTGRALVFESVLAETIPPAPDKLVKDARLSPGSVVVATEAQYGYKYDLYKNIYDNGQITGREKVNTSVYKPVQGVISVGGE